MSDIKAGEVFLGKLINSEQCRDAIHVAIAPVVADEKLAPGQDIGFVDAVNVDRVGMSDTPIGIVDPFLKNMVFPGQKFWMLLYPNTITSLRHDWTHPAFEQPERSDSEGWLREFSERAGLAYDRMIEIVTEYIDSGDPWVEIDSERARDAWYAVDQSEFWHHFQNVTGIKKPNHDWDAPFSCSC